MVINFLLVSKRGNNFVPKNGLLEAVKTAKSDLPLSVWPIDQIGWSLFPFLVVCLPVSVNQSLGMIAYSTSYGKSFPIRELCWWEEPITNSGRIFLVIGWVNHSWYMNIVQSISKIMRVLACVAGYEGIWSFYQFCHINPLFLKRR